MRLIKKIITKDVTIATVIILIGLIVGFRIGNIESGSSMNLHDMDISFAGGFVYIFLKNLFTCAIIILGLGWISLPIVFQQGVNLGFMFGLVFSYTNDKNTILLALPHCLLEIPVIIIAAALSMKLLRFIKTTKHNSFKESFFIFYKQNKKLIISVPVLLVISAIIESFITGYIFHIIGG